MATLVKFYYEPNTPKNDVVAVFPQLNWIPWSKLTKTSYAHIGQHSAISVDYIKTLTPVTDINDCKDLIAELKGVGYDLKILNKFQENIYQIWKEMDILKRIEIADQYRDEEGVNDKIENGLTDHFIEWFKKRKF